METILQTLQKEYQEDPTTFLRQFECQVGNKIDECHFVEDNEVFILLNHKLNDIHKDYPKLTIEGSPIFSLVEQPGGWSLKCHNCLTFYSGNGCHLRISPEGEGIEITRFYVPEIYQGMGFGTQLMTTFLELLMTHLEKLPSLLVELTGSVGMGQNQLPSSIEAQERFFSGFGFWASDYENYPVYLKMMRNG